MRTQSSFQRAFMGIFILVVSAWLCMIWNEPSAEVVAQSKPKKQRQAFLSGGARSELVLREMLQVLKSMDRRLERIEKIAQSAQQKREADPRR